MDGWYLTTNHKVPTLSRRHTLGVPHIKYVVDLSTLGTIPHSVQYHTWYSTTLVETHVIYVVDLATLGAIPH